jgi:hypothetical protein
MGRLKLLGTVLLAVLALSAVTASGAWAGGPGVDLKLEETVVAPGSGASSAILIDGCVVDAEGKLASNGKSKDKASFTHALFSECEQPETAIAGINTGVTITDTGMLEFKSSVVLTAPGPCNYSVKKYTVPFTFSPEDSTVGETNLAVKLSKKGSSPSCAKEATFPVLAVVGDAEGGVYGAELL